MKRKINLSILNDVAGNPAMVTIKFGPHYYLRVEELNGETKFSLGATHHGFTVDASKVGGELEDVINFMRQILSESLRPDRVHDNFQ